MKMKIFNNDSILSNISATATGPNPNPNKSDNNSKVSAVTGRQQFEKGVNKRKAELETDLRYKLRDRLSSKKNDTKDEDQLYGDLLATKLRKLSKLKAKHEIDNVMFKYQLENEEGLVRRIITRKYSVPHQRLWLFLMHQALHTNFPNLPPKRHLINKICPALVPFRTFHSSIILIHPIPTSTRLNRILK